jgi:NCAIR mutase (PurE)-related protein
MDPARLKSLLGEVAAGRTTVDAAVEELRALPFREIAGVATVDHHRGLRLGFPEVIYGQGKTASEIAAILVELDGSGHPALATRVDADKAARIAELVPSARFEARAQCVIVNEAPFEDRG